MLVKSVCILRGTLSHLAPVRHLTCHWSAQHVTSLEDRITNYKYLEHVSSCAHWKTLSYTVKCVVKGTVLAKKVKLCL